MKAKILFVFITLIIVVIIILALIPKKHPIKENEEFEGEKEESSLNLLPCWWTSTWSEDGLNLNVNYTRGNNTLSEIIHVENFYNPYSEQIEKVEVTRRNGEDIYGRMQNITINIPSGYMGGSIKPNEIMGQGTFIFPNGTTFNESRFKYSFNTTITYEYNEKGQLTGGSSIEEFYGHISTSTGKIPFVGNVNRTFTTRNGQLVWTQLNETTNYYYEDRFYANTNTTIIPQSELSGEWHIVREDIKTTTIYADNSQRESEIVILWQRDEFGICTGISGSGVITGIEIINKIPIPYTGSITIVYGYDSKVGYHKIDYIEKRTAETELLKCLPFEAIFIEDLYLMPLNY